MPFNEVRDKLIYKHFHTYMKRIKDGSYKARNEHRERLIQLSKAFPGSKLKWVDARVFKDLVLFDKNGVELGRSSSTNPVGYICNHFLSLSDKAA